MYMDSSCGGIPAQTIRGNGGRASFQVPLILRKIKVALCLSTFLCKLYNLFRI